MIGAAESILHYSYPSLETILAQQDQSEFRASADLTPELMTQFSAGTFTDLIGLKFTEISPEGVWAIKPGEISNRTATTDCRKVTAASIRKGTYLG